MSEKTADEMFEELRYIKDYEDNDVVKYVHYVDSVELQQIKIYKDDGTIYKKSITSVTDICLKEHKAINKKLQELGRM